jgi:hypothetical protein
MSLYQFGAVRNSAISITVGMSNFIDFYHLDVSTMSHVENECVFHFESHRISMLVISDQIIPNVFVSGRFHPRVAHLSQVTKPLETLIVQICGSVDKGLQRWQYCCYSLLVFE